MRRPESELSVLRRKAAQRRVEFSRRESGRRQLIGVDRAGLGNGRDAAAGLTTKTSE